MDNEAVKQMIVVPQAASNPNLDLSKVAFFEEDGTAITVLTTTPTGAQVLLTGLVGGTATPVAATDTVNQAIAKLQAEAVAAPTFPAVVTATAIATAAKTTTSAEPAANTIVVIKFTNGNSAAAPTVAFNGGTARAIQLGGATPSGAEITIAANGVAMFWFDGTILHQFGVQS